MTLAEQVATGVTPDFIRLSVGFETVEDIIADIEQALMTPPAHAQRLMPICNTPARAAHCRGAGGSA